MINVPDQNVEHIKEIRVSKSLPFNGKDKLGLLKGCKIYAVPLLLLFGLVEESSRHKVNSGENAMLTLYFNFFCC